MYCAVLMMWHYFSKYPNICRCPGLRPFFLVLLGAIVPMKENPNGRWTNSYGSLHLESFTIKLPSLGESAAGIDQTPTCVWLAKPNYCIATDVLYWATARIKLPLPHWRSHRWRSAFPHPVWPRCSMLSLASGLQIPCIQPQQVGTWPSILLVYTSWWGPHIWRAPFGRPPPGGLPIVMLTQWGFLG